MRPIWGFGRCIWTLFCSGQWLCCRRTLRLVQDNVTDAIAEAAASRVGRQGLQAKIACNRLRDCKGCWQRPFEQNLRLLDAFRLVSSICCLLRKPSAFLPALCPLPLPFTQSSIHATCATFIHAGTHLLASGEAAECQNRADALVRQLQRGFVHDKLRRCSGGNKVRAPAETSQKALCSRGGRHQHPLMAAGGRGRQHFQNLNSGRGKTPVQLMQPVASLAADRLEIGWQAHGRGGQDTGK